MRHRLSTLLIVLAILPFVLALGWSEYAKYRERERQREEARRLLEELERLVKPSPYPVPPHW